MPETRFESVRLFGGIGVVLLICAGAVLPGLSAVAAVVTIVSHG